MRRILALGGHDFTSRPPDRAVCELLLRLAAERGGERPRICLLPTASGDPAEQIGRFYAAFGERACEPSDVSLFRLGRRPMELRDHLLDQDLIYVGGGSLVNLLAVWEAHDIAAILSLAWRQRHRPRRPERRGDVLVRGRDHQVVRQAARRRRPRPAPRQPLRPLQQRARAPAPPTSAAVGDGMPGGYGLDDYAGLLWEGDGQLPRRSTARRGARAYRVSAATPTASPSRRCRRASCRRRRRRPLREDIAEFRRHQGDAQTRRLARLMR